MLFVVKIMHCHFLALAGTTPPRTAEPPNHGSAAGARRSTLIGTSYVEYDKQVKAAPIHSAATR